MSPAEQTERRAGEADATAGEDARVAGRGFLFITFAKVYFMATGALVSLALPRLLGSPALFGDYTVVNRFISLFNAVMIAGTIQAVSKAVSERDGIGGAARRAALLVQLGVGVPIALALVLSADAVALWVFQDARLGPFLRIASLITLFYCFYGVFVGLANGTKRFLTQASLDVTFSTLKTGAVIGFVLLGFGVAGAFTGFAGAALLIMLVSFFATRAISGGRREDVPFGKILAFMLPVFAYTLLVNVPLQSDNLMLKALTFEPLFAHYSSSIGRLQAVLLFSPLGAGVPADPESARPLLEALATHGTSTLSGFYGAMRNVANLPYQAIIAITFVAFPMISRATFDADEGRARIYVAQTFRYTLILMSLVVVPLIATSRDLVLLLYGADYAIGVRTLDILLVAIIGFALFYLGNTIVTGSGRPKVAAVLGLVVVAVNLGLLALFLLTADLWQHALEATAWATLLSMLVGMVLVAFYLLRRFGAVAPAATLVRVPVLSAAICLAARHIPVHGFLGVALKAGAAGVALLVAYFVTREFGAEDRSRLRSVLGRDRAGGEPPAREGNPSA